MLGRLAQTALAAGLGAAVAYVWLAPRPERAADGARIAVEDGADLARDDAAVTGEGADGDQAAPAYALAEPDAADDDALALPEAERANREAVALAADGDFAGAAVLLRDAVERDPGNALYSGNLQAVLINGGFAAIEDERFDAAVGLFVEALGIGDRGEVRRGLGYAYYKLGNLDLARISLARALELQEGDAQTYLTLGRLYLEKHDQASAREMLQRALALGADQPGLADTVERLEQDAAAEEGFQALSSSHFVLKFEGRENTQAGRLVLNALEEAYRTVGARFAYYPEAPVEVVLYPDEMFRAVTNSPHWSGAVYDGRIKMPIGGLEHGSDRLRRTLRHEYAHAAIVTMSRGKAPVWLNEGLAQVAEDPEVSGRMNRLRLGLAAGDLFALADLERDFTSLDRERASLAYAQAYYAARWLLEQKGAYNVRRLLEALATAPDVDAALKTTLSLPYAELENRLAAALARDVG